MDNWRLKYPEKLGRIRATKKRPSLFGQLRPKRSDWQDHTLVYLKKRGLNPVFMESMQTLYPCEQGIVYLLHPGGFTVRVTQPGSLPRFDSQDNLSPAAIYCPLIQPFFTGPLFVVEGQADALAVGQCHYNSVATLGSNVRSQQIRTITDWAGDMFDKVYFILDSDSAGWVGWDMFNRYWDHDFCPAQPLFLPEGYKDFAEVPRLKRSEFLRSVQGDKYAMDK